MTMIHVEKLGLRGRRSLVEGLDEVNEINHNPNLDILLLDRRMPSTDIFCSGELIFYSHETIRRVLACEALPISSLIFHDCGSDATCTLIPNLQICIQ